MPKDKSGDEPLVRVTTAPNEPIAVMWADVLEQEGIRCMIRRTAPAWMIYSQSALLPYDIFVLASQAEKATSILSSPVIEVSDDVQGEET